MENTLGGAIAEGMGEAIRHVRSVEKLLALVPQIAAVSTALTELVEHDPDAAPELASALTALVAVGAAVEQTYKYLDARYDTTMQRVFADLLPPEGS